MTITKIMRLKIANNQMSLTLLQIAHISYTNAKSPPKPIQPQALKIHEIT
jgi:hypothetical protein